MTPEKHIPTEEEKNTQLLEEICEHTMAIRRVANRILDHLHEYQIGATASENSDYNPEDIGWDDLDDNDDMYY